MKHEHRGMPNQSNLLYFKSCMALNYFTSMLLAFCTYKFILLDTSYTMHYHFSLRSIPQTTYPWSYLHLQTTYNCLFVFQHQASCLASNYLICLFILALSAPCGELEF